MGHCWHRYRLLYVFVGALVVTVPENDSAGVHFTEPLAHEITVSSGWAAVNTSGCTKW
jgi:hypothetical protein